MTFILAREIKISEFNQYPCNQQWFHFKINKEKWNKKAAELQRFDDFHFMIGFCVVHIVKFNRTYVGYKFMRQ